MPKDYDFAGYVTKNDLRCSDGVIIKQDAFGSQDATKVPLVWSHSHDDPNNVLGHMQLKNVSDGVYGYGYFNETEAAQNAKEAIDHGDINAMSIWANHIQKNGDNVVHGNIVEVSLVLAGANPGALIDEVISHSDDGDDIAATIYTDYLIHSAKDELKDEGEPMDNSEEKQAVETVKDEGSEKTVGEVYETLTDEQKAAVEFLLAEAIEADPEEGEEPTEPEAEPEKEGPEPEKEEEKPEDDKEKEKEEEKKPMAHNVFENDKAGNETVLSHSDLNNILHDAVNSKASSLKELIIAHEDPKYGITNIEKLFPEAENLNKTPLVYNTPNQNADKIVNAISKSPFSRIKTTVADITNEEARAKGYIKATEKIESFFSVLDRTTTPQTVYIKQKLDRDDIVDITDFNVVQFTQAQMRVKLTEELAQAALIGDGRAANHAQKIKEDNIRPIVKDDDFYTIKATYTDETTMLEDIIVAMGDYMGSGSPSLYINPKDLAKVKLVKAADGRYLFGDIPTDASMAARMGVSEIVPTIYMKEGEFLIVNLHDYQFGATAGGQLTSFDDFDIDFNQYKYLLETRISGALVLPKSAIYFKKDPAKAKKAQGSAS